MARAWVLIDDGVVARFGAALAWGSRFELSSLDVLVDGSPSAPGIIARRAACFSSPPRVWAVAAASAGASARSSAASPSSGSPSSSPSSASASSGSPSSSPSSAPRSSSVSLTVADPALPVPDSAESPPPDLAALLESHGLEVVWEHGVLRGEVLGLEVARTVGDRLEVGVGRHDRIARFEMRPSESTSSALAEASAAVRSLRRRDAPSHPANTLARSRWLRSVLVSFPGVIGLSSLRPVAPPLPWFDLPEAGPAPAVGVSASTGAPVVVVCSVGIDLDLVPTAADCRLLYGQMSGGAAPVVAGCASTGAAELWLVVPEGDDPPVTRSLAARLEPAARIVTVPRNWQDLAAGGGTITTR